MDFDIWHLVFPIITYFIGGLLSRRNTLRYMKKHYTLVRKQAYKVNKDYKGT